MRVVTLLIKGFLFAALGVMLMLLAVGFSIEQFCSYEGQGLLSMHTSTCRLIGDYEGNDARALIHVTSALLGAVAGILFVARQSRRKNVQ